jgi:hypothetical protein
MSTRGKRGREEPEELYVTGRVSVPGVDTDRLQGGAT